MKDGIIFDLGTSVVKVYFIENYKVKDCKTKSFHFNKNNFLSKKQHLFKYLSQFLNHKSTGRYAFGTAFFRSFNEEELKNFKDEFYVNVGFDFNLMSHEEESCAMVRYVLSKIPKNASCLAVNIGGGSTEICVIKDLQVVERFNVNIGGVVINDKFNLINEEVSFYEFDEISLYCDSFFKNSNHHIDFAFYTGGELSFMSLCEYNLIHNDLFDDAIESKKIFYEDFYKQSRAVCNKILMRDLKLKMPNDPDWMLGVRARSAIANSIFAKYNVKQIIPSDCNTVDGMIIGLRDKKNS